VGGVLGWRLLHPTGATVPSTPNTGSGNTEEIKKPTPPVVPIGFKAATEEVVEDFQKRRLFKSIVVDRAGYPALRFVLIDQRRDTDPPSFYLTETKVSNTVFAAFVRANPADGEPDWASLPGELPALGMTADRARACAAWLGGVLPSARQW